MNNKVIIVISKENSFSSEAIFRALKPHFNVSKILSSSAIKDGILLFRKDIKEEGKGCDEEIERFTKIIRDSGCPILVINNKINCMQRLVKAMPSNGYLVLNFDDQELRSLKDHTKAHVLSYGLNEGADLRAAEIRITSDCANFKINYGGSIIPFWLDKKLGIDNIYDILSAICVGKINNINFVESSRLLKNNWI